MWQYGNTGDYAPTYYLQTDAPLYYYSFGDAAIAMAYKSLPPEQQARLDPMITGFNPADMYAADHIKRVLKTFPGVFTGIGEFSIHKEFVSSKVAVRLRCLAPKNIDSPMAVYNLYKPLWDALKPETSRKVRLENYERVFDEGRRKVREWEKANVPRTGRLSRWRDKYPHM